MTELRKQDIQAGVSSALARRRYRDDEIPCDAIEKDPDGGLKCTARGMALDSPQVWYGHNSAEQTLTGSFAVLEIDTEDLNTSTDHFSFASNQLSVLKPGLFKLEVKVPVETSGGGRFAVEVIVDEDKGSGYEDQAETKATQGRGSL